jgi:hypothetical protein
LVALGATVALALGACSSGSTPSAEAPTTASTSGPTASGPTASGGASLDSLPLTTWPLPADPSAAAQKAGLQMLGEEELAVHYHSHLDIVAGGKRVVVPQYVGIDVAQQKISALHTHDTSGIVHIESAKDVPFTLGQFFTEWGQPLSTTAVGPVTAGSGEKVIVYRNGSPVAGDPAKLVLKNHDEIFIYVGAPAAQPAVPASYAFPQGY